MIIATKPRGLSFNADWPMMLSDEEREAVLRRMREMDAQISFPKRKKKNGSGSEATTGAVGLQDFVAYMPLHSYIFIPSREMWPASSVNARVSCASGTASAWLDEHSPVEQMTWAPSQPMLIRDRLVSDGGWIERKGCTVFNLYRPPVLTPEPGDVEPWLSHLKRMYPADGAHILRWLAHRVQKPGEKINHALVLGGAQGIGKDTLLEPIKHAVGPWNFIEVSPQQALGRFNGFLKSVILRVSEARDLGEVDRFSFYDHMKAYTSAPPDVLRVDEKHLREHSVLNVCGVIITSNHKTDGIFLPPDDRRHFVAWSSLTKDHFPDGYWNRLYAWYELAGSKRVMHFLRSFDLTDFDAKAPPPKTEAFFEIVDAQRPPEDAELADALDGLGRPSAVTLDQIASRADPSFQEWLRDRKNARRIPHRMEECDYVAVRNPDATDGRWKTNGRRQVVYARAELSPRERIQHVYQLTGAR
jgi:hypothetical protein